ncbi:translation initiation factor IF-2 [Chloroflexota bacterium]
MTRAGKLDKVPRVTSKKKASDSSSATKTNLIELTPSLSVRQLAELIQLSPIDIIKQLMRNGVMANINQAIDYDMAASVVTHFGYEPHLKARTSQRSSSSIGGIKQQREAETKKTAGLKERPPVVTVMGHVDHGKTRLLDTIRKTDVMATEAGGITQHIGAYQVDVNGKRITFLDTPGHEAFTAMRAHGAHVADITILVVAADDGVMPQTLEAINHSRAAEVPVLVAINKIDKPDANPDIIKQQLADAGLIIEEWGGDVVCLQISAREMIGISELMENLLIVAEMEDLKADPSLPATGVVIEAEMDKSKGPLATVLVSNGTLKLGDTVVVNTIWGRVRAMFNDVGKRVRKAEPATPVEILGLGSVPQVGDIMNVVANEHQARALIEAHQIEMEREASVRLDNILDQISAGKVKELNVILKTDVQGSIEPVKTSLERLGTEEVRVRIIHTGTGNVTESDVMLAIAAKGLIISFGTGYETGAKRLAEVRGVDIRHYEIIYNLVDDVEKALKGMLEPSYVEVISGRAEVRAMFSVGKNRSAAGVYVTEGEVSRGSSVRIWREQQMICETTVNSLKRFKEDVREVATGYECGVGVDGFSEFQVGDILEFFHKEKAEGK